MFGEILKKLRKEKGSTQDEMAKILDIKRQTYSAYERGISLPDLNTLLKLSDFFKVTTDFLLGKELISEPTPREQLEALLRSPEFRDTTVAFQNYEEWTDDEIQSIIEYIEGKRLLKESKKK